MQVPLMKLNEEQCSNLPFRVGVRVWYNIKFDALGGDCHVAARKGVHHGQIMKEKSGASLCTTDASRELPVVLGNNFTFNVGVVKEVNLDMNTVPPNILYQISRLDIDDVPVFAPEKMYTDKDLYYGPGTPVSIKPKMSDNEESTIAAQVLLCHLKHREPAVAESIPEADDRTAKNTILAIKAAIARENARILSLHKQQTDSQHINTITSLLECLLSVEMTNDLLTLTKIGASISKLKSHENACVANLAKTLINRWHSVDESSDPYPSITATKQLLEQGNDETILDELCALNNINVTYDLLKDTGIGISVNKFKKSENRDISILAKTLVAKWKEIVHSDKKIKAIKVKLEAGADDEGILNELRVLDKIDITADVLKSTKIGATVVSLRNCQVEAISKLAHKLVQKWKDLDSDAASSDQPKSALSVKEEKSVEPEFVYTVKVIQDDGSFRIEDNIALDCVKYRQGYTEKEEPHTEKPQSTADKIDVGINGQSSNTGQLIENGLDARNPTREQPVGGETLDVINTNSHHQRGELASPSTLSRSVTALEQPHSDSHSQQSSQKRKSAHLDRNIHQIKRPCSADDHSEANIAKDSNDAAQGTSDTAMAAGDGIKDESVANNFTIPIQPCHATRLVGSKGSVIKNIERKSRCQIDVIGKGPFPHVSISGTNPYDVKTAIDLIRTRIAEIEIEDNGRQHHTHANSITIPLRQEIVPRLIGAGGKCIHDIESKTGAFVSIRGQGTNPRNGYVDASDEPLHAKITGTPSANKAAAKMIHKIISDIDDHRVKTGRHF